MSAAPLRTPEFADLLLPLAPGGALAVAVSGGADSMALLLLAAEWAHGSGQTLTALTVDHDLRPESGAEACQVGAAMAARGIRHFILKWRGPKPTTGIQAAAREARYGLLTQWCREHGVLDLLVGHHQDDQHETVLLRATRSSGADGRAGMAIAVHRDGVRLLRPLLSVPKARLRATLVAAGQAWLEDPSNGNPRYARVRARAALADAPAASTALARQAAAHGALRAERDAATAAWLAAHVTLAEAGYAWLAADALGARDDTVLRGLALALRAVGGSPYGPRRDALKGVVRWMRSAPPRSARTLHRCLLARQDDRFLLCREARGLRTVALPDGATAVWDDRFRLGLRGGNGPYEAGPLGEEGWQAVRHRAAAHVPYLAARSLPALWAAGEVVAVPHLGVETPGLAFSVSLMSAETLALRPFAVVSGPG